MNAAEIAALGTAIPAILGAITALIAVFRHQNNPGAHGGQGHP